MDNKTDQRITCIKAHNPLNTKLQQSIIEKCSYNERNILTEGIIDHWNNLPKCVVDSALFEVFIIELLVCFKAYFSQKHFNVWFRFMNHRETSNVLKTYARKNLEEEVLQAKHSVFLNY